MPKRICPICEAACGLSVSADGRQIIAIEPNKQDVFSRGHACAKGLALAELDTDPDRLRRPRIKEHGQFRDGSWEEAYRLIQQKFKQIRAEYGNQSIATYIGNPTAHNIGSSFGLGPLMATLGSTNFYSAGSVDQLPKQLASELMFGNSEAVPVPDITRTDLLLMLGANPAVSNGSLWVVPKFRQHLRDMQNRGGRLITVDPRRTETARLADQHLFIKPGSDAWLLAALINEVLRLGAEPDPNIQTRGLATLKQGLSQVSLAEAAARTGIAEADIQQLALQLKQAPRAAVYGRVGTTLQAFGTLTSFLVEVLNLVTGNLDSVGGAMFPDQPFSGAPTQKSSIAYNRYQSRVSKHPEVLGQLPLVALAEEILTPGEGQVRALITLAGNPVVSGPDSDKLTEALEQLEFMVAIDIYENETTRHADVILPGHSPFEKSHYDHFLGSMGYRNAARYSPAMFQSDQPSEWDQLLTLAYCINANEPPDAAALKAFEDNIVLGAIVGHTDNPNSPLYGRDVQELMGLLPDQGVERLLDLGIRAGRWGDRFGVNTNGVTLQKLIDTPDGIDLGDIEAARLNDLVRLPDQKLDLAPREIMDELTRLVNTQMLQGLQLVGRRSVNTNNSWLHNLPMLTKGKAQCVLEIHPADAEARGLTDGGQAWLRTHLKSIAVEVSVTENMAPGVVSLPHGFSREQGILANQTKGANYNSLVATDQFDMISRTATLNGVPVEVES